MFGIVVWAIGIDDYLKSITSNKVTNTGKGEKGNRPIGTIKQNLLQRNRKIIFQNEVAYNTFILG